MKKLLILSVAASAMLMAGTNLTTKELTEIKNSTKILENPALTLVKGEDRGSVYFLKLKVKDGRGGNKNIEGFVDKSNNAIYLGGGYTYDGKKISFPVDTAVVEKSVLLTYGNGPKELYIVTDPECPYCTKFAVEAKDKLSEYTVKVIMYPLPFHKEAPAMVDYILAGKNNAEKVARYDGLMTAADTSYKSATVDPKRLRVYLDKSNDAVSELEVQGTPTFFIKNGNKLDKIGWGDLLKQK